MSTQTSPHPTQHWDFLIKNGTLFDGSGQPPVKQDIAIKDGKIADIGKDLRSDLADETFDARGQWVMPGLLDIHTHYDLEIELSPGLPESVRHGTTTVVMSNCSLGLAFGAQRVNDDDPIVSCFARVENMPKSVLKRVADSVSWENSKDYLDHLDELKLGPNVVPLIPHSMLRIEAMGLEDSVSRDPTSDELETMKTLLKTGMDQGYAGFSTDALPFHFLANDPNREKQIPTQFASYKELKTLTQIVRDYDRIWQATPPKDNTIGIFKTLSLCSGRLHGKPLKTTVVAAMDVSTNRTIVVLARLLARILNSKLLNGRFYLQALAAPFKVWSDGMYSPLSEEIDELRELIELDIEDRSGRMALLNDPAFIARFKSMWMKGKEGFSLARLKRKLRLEEYAFSRDLDQMYIDQCPLKSWQNKTFEDVYRAYKDNRLDIWDNNSGEETTENGKSWADYKSYFETINDEADFVLATLRAFDTEIIWSTISANKDPRLTRKLLMDPILLPGFNDSGAHLTNMAFYDCNLRALKSACEGGLGDVSYMVKRLTKDAATLFGLDVGELAVGHQADITVINPDTLNSYEADSKVQRVRRPEFQHEQLVNRSDGVVSIVMINGKPAWQGTQLAANLGTQKMGRALRAQ